MFGFGPRSCLGEVVARTELFLFTTRLFQNFEISPSFKDPKPTLTNGILRVGYGPLPYEIIVKKRINQQSS